MAFSTSDPASSRAFVRSVLGGGGMRGRLRKPLDSYTPAYVARLANRWQGEATRGEPLSPLSAARGHVTTAEHPPQRVRGGVVMRTYQGGAQSRRAALRWLERLPERDSIVQVTALGTFTSTYRADAVQARGWRTVYTGPLSAIGGPEGLDDLLDALYEDDEIEKVEIRWESGQEPAGHHPPLAERWGG